jgi:hypothetical protein
MKNAYGVLVGNLKDRDPWKSRRRWEDNIKMGLI